MALLVAAAVWLPLLHLIYAPRLSDYISEGPVSPKAKALAGYHLRLWKDPALREREIAKIRKSNAEWDFMARTFFVLSLANMSLREPSRKDEYLEIIDTIIDETIRLDSEEGVHFFLMPYSRNRPFICKPPRSLFVDGEIALMIGARQLVEEKEEYKPHLKRLVGTMTDYMGRGKVMCAESYPDECWMFCNSVALAAIKISDALDGTDHSKFFDAWLVKAREKLVDRKTGMLISSFTYFGAACDGPEGSSIWLVAHCLQLIDEAFAEDQYRRARKELGRELLGFGYAREWPESRLGAMDIDSGPVVPVFGASPGATGLALVGAAAFGDREYYSSLCASLNIGAFPVERKGTLKYCASNQVGDAVMLYSMVLGPLWEEAKERQRP